MVCDGLRQVRQGQKRKLKRYFRIESGFVEFVERQGRQLRKVRQREDREREEQQLRQKRQSLKQVGDFLETSGGEASRLRLSRDFVRRFQFRAARGHAGEPPADAAWGSSFFYRSRGLAQPAALLFESNRYARARSQGSVEFRRRLSG